MSGGGATLLWLLYKVHRQGIRQARSLLMALRWEPASRCQLPSCCVFTWPFLPAESPMNPSAPKHHPKASSPVPSRCKLGLQCRNQRGRKHAIHRGDYGDRGVGAVPAGLDGQPLAELCPELHGLWARAQVGILGLPVVGWVIAG